MYTLFVDGELYTDVIDDIYPHEPWGVGGLLLKDQVSALALAVHLSTYSEYKDSNFEIKELQVKQ